MGIIEYIFWIVIGLGLMIAIFMGARYLDGLTDESNQKIYDFYKETCPKLNSELIEPKNYVYNPKCFRVINNEIKKYYISEINGEYYLSEI